MPRDFIPASDAQFDLWLTNFSDQLNTRGSTMGFTVDELADFVEAVQRWQLAFGQRRTKADAARAATAEKRAARSAVMTSVRPYARRVQAHPTTTDAIRAEMGLSTMERLGGGTASLTAPDDLPLLLLDFGTRGQITVHFGPNPANENRNGLPAGAIGVAIQTRTAAEAPAAWEWLDNATSSPYTHIVQPAEVTMLSYRCAYLYSRGRRGPWSATAEAAVTP